MAVTDSVRLARRLGWLDPRQMAATTAALTRWGPSLAALYAAAAVRHRTRAAIVDHRGTVSFGELDRSSSALAQGLRSLDLAGGDHLGVLCANHRDFVDVSIAAAKAGLACVYLNTGFAAPQLGEVLRPVPTVSVWWWSTATWSRWSRPRDSTVTWWWPTATPARHRDRTGRSTTSARWDRPDRSCRASRLLRCC